MALPTNSSLAKQQGCNPVSSNCVVWQGPDLDCIGLCKGDTISDVVAKMAKELCDLIDLVSLAPTSTTPFDFTCLLQAGQLPPENIHELIQLIIDRLCNQIGETNTIEGDISVIDKRSGSGSDCPENCIVDIASCFYYTNPQGDQVTTMTIVEYATAIGNKICDILLDISVIQGQILTLQADVSTNASDIATLQSTMVVQSDLDYTLDQQLDPTLTPQSVVTALKVVENSYLGLRSATGLPSNIYTGISQFSTYGQNNALSNTGLVSGFPNWISNAVNLGEWAGNIGIAIKDLYEAVATLQLNTPTGCGAIDYNFRATLATGPGTAVITLFLDGSTGLTGFADCSPLASNLTITDTAGNSTTTSMPIISTVNDLLGFSVDIYTTSIDTSLSLTIELESCVANNSTGVTCQQILDYIIVSTAACPSVTLQAYNEAIQFDYSSSVGYTYRTQLYYLGGTSPVQIITDNAPAATVAGTFSSLTENTDYEVEVVVIDALGNETSCPKTSISTLIVPCLPPVQNGVNPIAVLTT